jgi:AcrR family transcriptional regulator
MKTGQLSSLGVSQKWIEAGYEMFATVGPKDFSVESLARIMGMNKSGFYHYFGDRDIFFQDLMEYHDNHGKKFYQEVSKLKEFMPGYLNTLMKYHTGHLMQIQLRKNFTEPLFKEYYYKVKERNNIVQIPLWAKYLNLNDLTLASELFTIVSDLVVARIETNNITRDFLEGTFEGIKNTVNKIQLHNRNTSGHTISLNYINGK